MNSLTLHKKAIYSGYNSTVYNIVANGVVIAKLEKRHVWYRPIGSPHKYLTQTRTVYDLKWQPAGLKSVLDRPVRVENWYNERAVTLKDIKRYLIDRSL